MGRPAVPSARRQGGAAGAAAATPVVVTSVPQLNAEATASSAAALAVTHGPRLLLTPAEQAHPKGLPGPRRSRAPMRRPSGANNGGCAPVSGGVQSPSS